jgi:hypothetical protein
MILLGYNIKKIFYDFNNLNTIFRIDLKSKGDLSKEFILCK